MPSVAYVRIMGLEYPPDWVGARCAEDDIDPDIFFPERSVYTIPLKAARNCCRECMIRRTCLSYAMDNKIIHGVWGGFTPQEREALKGLPWERLM